MTESYETRYYVPWADCVDCGANSVYATHEGNPPTVGPDTLTLTCEGCGAKHIASAYLVRKT